jgi:hypothetical protein
MGEVVLYHKLHHETFHLAVSYLDRFLETSTAKVSKQRLQLYAAGSLLIAGKLEVFLGD